MEGTSLGIAIAFTAGLLSFLSPCVLPLIPSYVTFITGLSLEDVQKARRAALIHSLLFVLGFTLIFLALGATATALGQLHARTIGQQARYERLRRALGQPSPTQFHSYEVLETALAEATTLLAVDPAPGTAADVARVIAAQPEKAADDHGRTPA